MTGCLIPVPSTTNHQNHVQKYLNSRYHLSFLDDSFQPLKHVEAQNPPVKPGFNPCISSQDDGAVLAANKPPALPKSMAFISGKPEPQEESGSLSLDSLGNMLHGISHGIVVGIVG